MTFSSDLRVTTEILWRGAAILALIDAAFVGVLIWRIKSPSMRGIKWTLIPVTGIFWCIVWMVMVSVFWEPVYHYVFPAWARWFIPPVYGVAFAAVGWLFWRLAVRLPGNPVLNICLLGGLLGMVTHLWAIYRGILDKPPMLRGASPLAAAIMPVFEFMFYWCIILSASFLLRHAREWAQRL